MEQVELNWTRERRVPAFRIMYKLGYCTTFIHKLIETKIYFDKRF